MNLNALCRVQLKKLRFAIHQCISSCQTLSPLKKRSALKRCFFLLNEDVKTIVQTIISLESTKTPCTVEELINIFNLEPIMSSKAVELKLMQIKKGFLKDESSFSKLISDIILDDQGGQYSGLIESDTLQAFLEPPFPKSTPIPIPIPPSDIAFRLQRRNSFTGNPGSPAPKLLLTEYDELQFTSDSSTPGSPPQPASFLDSPPSPRGSLLKDSKLYALASQDREPSPISSHDVCQYYLGREKRIFSEKEPGNLLFSLATSKITDGIQEKLQKFLLQNASQRALLHTSFMKGVLRAILDASRGNIRGAEIDAFYHSSKTLVEYKRSAPCIKDDHKWTNLGLAAARKVIQIYGAKRIRMSLQQGKILRSESGLDNSAMEAMCLTEIFCLTLGPLLTAPPKKTADDMDLSLETQSTYLREELTNALEALILLKNLIVQKTQLESIKIKITQSPVYTLRVYDTQAYHSG